jgi:hypothetical protein
MLPSTARNITRDTDIKRTITLAGEDVDAKDPSSSYPEGLPWVPAFAGTTEICRPDTEEDA